jgi:(1->4)-alpha-D-glucan 1-alpha-D-glucosylmutase
MNDRWRTRLGTRLAPSRNMEYLLYQAMIASFPLGGFAEPGYADRIQAQALKSAREGKAETSWLNPNGDYERALADFVAALFDPERSAGFQADFARFVDTLRRPGYWNSLVQAVLKCTVPGVPDIYQGGEFWDLSMVDPDNRRPIDFDARRRALEASDASGEEPAARAAFLRDAIADLDSALLKADVLRRLLQARRRCPTLFLNGGYHPLEVSGERARRIVAFSRSSGTSSLVVVAARFFAGCDAPDGFDADAWGDTTVRHPRATPEPMTELFTGRQVTLGREFRVADFLSPLPFAVLVRAR